MVKFPGCKHYCIWLQKLPQNKSGTKEIGVNRGNSDSTGTFFSLFRRQWVASLCPFFLGEKSHSVSVTSQLWLYRFWRDTFTATNFAGNDSQLDRSAYTLFIYEWGNNPPSIVYYLQACYELSQYLRRSSLSCYLGWLGNVYLLTRDVHFKWFISIG